MVLVSYILDTYISISQTKFSYGEGHEAQRVGPEAMPLDQHIEGRHGEREARMEIRPASMQDLLEMAHKRQHRQPRFDEDAVLPLPALAEFEVSGIPLGGME